MEFKMKKFAVLLATVAMLASSTGFAQTSTSKASQAGKSAGMSTGFAWGIAVVGIAVIAAVAAGTGAESGKSPSTNSH